MPTGLINLRIYQLAKDVELSIHELTKQFPFDERYRSIDQLKRSSSAVANNVAEAYNKESVKEKIHILRDIAICEAEETESNIHRCGEKGFIPIETADEFAAGYIKFKKSTYTYIRFLRSQIN